MGGNVKFITEYNFILVTTKKLLWIRELSSTYMHSIQVDMLNIFEI